MHLSALALDALALGTETAGARDHLVTCARCRGDYEAAAALREHFIAHVLPRVQPRRARILWPWLAVPAFAAALGLLVIIARPQHAPTREVDLAIKGDATWQVFANRDGQTFAIARRRAARARRSDPLRGDARRRALSARRVDRRRRHRVDLRAV